MSCDFCFCECKDCPRVDCKRHLKNSPVNVPFSMSRLWNGDFTECDWYEALRKIKT